MNKHETTGGEVFRSINKIDFRELKELQKRADEGDEIAKNELAVIKENLRESGVIERTVELSQKILSKYIEAFNNVHHTNFSSLEQIENYFKEKGEVPDNIDFDEIVKSTAMVIRPKDYVHTLGRVTDKVFSNRLTLKEGESGKKRAVTLDKKKTVSVFVSVDYDKVLQNLGKKAKVPELSEDGRQVFDGIISNLIAGNKIMTYNMIYKGFTGDNNSRRLPLGMFEMISEALLSFRGWLKIEDNGTNKRTNQSYSEPLLMYRQYEENETVTINGKEIKGGEGIIQVYEIPALYRFAMANGEEVDTRPISLLNVPKINNTPENLRLKRYLYSRVIAMRNDYENNVLKNHRPMEKTRKIKYSSIFEYIGIEELDRKEKYKRVKKIESILNYWTDFGFIEGYEKYKNNGSNEIAGIEINFVKKLEEKKS